MEVLKRINLKTDDDTFESHNVGVDKDKVFLANGQTLEEYWPTVSAKDGLKMYQIFKGDAMAEKISNGMLEVFIDTEIDIDIGYEPYTIVNVDIEYPEAFIKDPSRFTCDTDANVMVTPIYDRTHLKSLIVTPLDFGSMIEEKIRVQFSAKGIWWREVIPPVIEANNITVTTNFTANMTTESFRGATNLYAYDFLKEPLETTLSNDVAALIRSAVAGQIVATTATAYCSEYEVSTSKDILTTVRAPIYPTISASNYTLTHADYNTMVSQYGTVATFKNTVWGWINPSVTTTSGGSPTLVLSDTEVNKIYTALKSGGSVSITLSSYDAGELTTSTKTVTLTYAMPTITASNYTLSYANYNSMASQYSSTATFKSTLLGWIGATITDTVSGSGLTVTLSDTEVNKVYTALSSSTSTTRSVSLTLTSYQGTVLTPATKSITLYYYQPTITASNKTMTLANYNTLAATSTTAAKKSALLTLIGATVADTNSGSSLTVSMTDADATSAFTSITSSTSTARSATVTLQAYHGSTLTTATKSVTLSYSFPTVPSTITSWYTCTSGVLGLTTAFKAQVNKASGGSYAPDGAGGYSWKTGDALPDPGTSVGGVSVTSYASMFQGWTTMTSLDLSKWTTTSVTNMNNMFNGCTGLKTLNVGGTFNISKISNPSSATNAAAGINHMFYGCSGLTSLDVSHFSRTSLTRLWGTFGGLTMTTANLKINGMETGSLVSVRQLFHGCTFSSTSTSNAVDISSFSWGTINTTSTSTSNTVYYIGCDATSLTRIKIGSSSVATTLNTIDNATVTSNSSRKITFATT